MKKLPLIPRRAVSAVIGLFCLLGCLAAYPLSTDKDQPMTGDVMTVYSKGGDELDHLIMEGNPATYQQLPDNSTVHDQAKAMRMEYYELKNLVVLIRDAWVKQESSTLVGERIEYNTELSRVKAWSRPGGGEGQETQQKSRVKLIIKKKKEDGS